MKEVNHKSFGIEQPQQDMPEPEAEPIKPENEPINPEVQPTPQEEDPFDFGDDDGFGDQMDQVDDSHNDPQHKDSIEIEEPMTESYPEPMDVDGENEPMDVD